MPSDEEDIDRRGSLPPTPRGSRISDLIQEKKKKTKRKDKHGFTWTPFIRDEELPLPRTPQPQMLAMVKPHIRINGDISKTKNPSDVSYRRNEDDIFLMKNIDPDLCSLPSENSFKTASSEPPEGVIPKQVSECYKKSPYESVRIERLSSIRKLQEQQPNVINNDSIEEDQQNCPQKPFRSNKRHNKE